MYKRALWALAVTGVVVIGIGWWQDWDFSETFTISKDWLDSSKVLKQATETATEGTQTAQNFLTDTVQQQKDTALSSVDKAKESLLAGAREQASTAISALERSLGLPGGGGESIDITQVNRPSTNFSFIATVRVNELAFFLVKNNDDTESQFLINWGDDIQAQGALQPNEEKLISHSWQTVGDHTISSEGQAFLIRVIQ